MPLHVAAPVFSVCVWCANDKLYPAGAVCLRSWCYLLVLVQRLDAGSTVAGIINTLVFLMEHTINGKATNLSRYKLM